MRIAYVLLHLEGRYIHTGVGKKIRTHVRLWNDLGHEVQLFLHTPDVEAFENAHLFKFSKQNGLLNREITRSRALAEMIRAVEAYRPDAIYLRYGIYAWPLERLFKIAPVFLEINTRDIEEYKYRGKGMYWYNRLNRGKILGRCAGFFPVTHEIANLPENLVYQKPTCVIANGVELDAIEPLPAPENPIPRMAFVGIPGIPWNGDDKLWPLLKKYTDLKVDMIGFGPEDYANQTLPPNVELFGRVPVERVRDLMRTADVAIGTLALHRKNLDENSPLKVRESLGYGIPTILAYTDTDLAAQSFDFLLTLPNTEDNVEKNMDAIHAFAYAMRGRRVDREAVRPFIDQRIKEERRLAFIQANLK